jgi:hypothetical protein
VLSPITQNGCPGTTLGLVVVTGAVVAGRVVVNGAVVAGPVVVIGAVVVAGPICCLVP